MAARRIHIDCETYRTRNQAVIDRIKKESIEATPAQSVAKAKKDDWHTDEAIAERVKCALAKTSVQPLYAEILTICIKTEGSFSYTIDAMEQTELSALIEFTDIVGSLSNENTIWTAFNGKKFDFMLLLNSMVRHGVRPPEHFPVYAGGWRGRIFDTMERMPTPDIYTSFVSACEAYGIECKTSLWKGEPMNGSRVGDAYEAGEYQIIRDYCMDDVLHEEQLYLAMTHNDTWGTFDNGSNDLAVLSEIALDDDMSPAHKWAAAYPILKSARLIL